MPDSSSPSQPTPHGDTDAAASKPAGTAAMLARVLPWVARVAWILVAVVGGVGVVMSFSSKVSNYCFFY